MYFLSIFVVKNGVFWGMLKEILRQFINNLKAFRLKQLIIKLQIA